jgi:serine/threonine protein kinase
MVCRVRYLSSAGIHPREIPGIDVLAQAYPANWLLYASLQCYPKNEPPLEIDAMVVMDDRVLLLEIKDWNGILSHNGDQWLLNGQRRGRSAVDLVSMKARKVKAFLKNVIPGFSKYYVDSRVVLTGSASKSGVAPTERSQVWTLQEAGSIATSSGKAALLQTTTFQLKKAFQFEPDFERITRNAKMFAPLEANWDGYHVVEEDFVVHPRRVWREHRAERIRDPRYKALLRIWSFDQLPPGLNSPDRRRFIADRETRAIGRLTSLGSKHFELRMLLPNWTTLDRYVARDQEGLSVDDRLVAVATLLNSVSELHANGIAHRDLGPRSVWTGGSTRIALTGFMSCQMPGEESIGDWAATLRGYADPAPEDTDPTLLATGKQRDVFALGRLAYQVLTGNPPLAAADLSGENLPEALPDLAAWIRRSTAKSPSNRFANAREMADEFAWIIEQAGQEDIDQTLIDRHETTDNPYVVYSIGRTLRQAARSHIFVTRDLAGDEFVVKVWMGLLRGMSAATDLALTRLFDGVTRLIGSPIGGLPDYVRTGLSPLGPFIVYRYEKGITLDKVKNEIFIESALTLATRLAQCVDALHALGCSHGDVAPKNILLRDSDGDLRLLDLFDLTEVGNGRVRTPSLCPQGWEALTEQQIDRYATLKIIVMLLEGAHDELLDTVNGIQLELQRAAIDTLEPALLLLRDASTRMHGPAVPQIAIRFSGGGPNFFLSDEGIYYLRASRPHPNLVEYSIAGIEREFTFGVVNGQVENVRVSLASFTSLSHASQHGVPVRVVILISDGPDSGFEDLFAFIAPLVAPTVSDDDVDAPGTASRRRLDVPRYWRKLLEFEQAFQPEVEILKEVGPSHGPMAAYAYERIGLDFDFDAGSTVEVRLPSGRKVGEVNLEQTDARTLVVEQSDRRLNVGERVNLVDRRARTSFDRRMKALERILDNEAAIIGLLDFFNPDHTVASNDFGTSVSDDILDTYRLNPGQKAAFRHVIRYGPVGLLQGPPGTGKTHFIAAFAHWLITQRGARKILIASQSNEAVNNVIEALLDLFKRLGGRRPSLLRIGSKGITDKIRPYHTSALRERYQSRFEAAFRHRVAGLGASLGLRRQFVSDAVEVDRKLGERVRRLHTLLAAEQGEGPIPADERRRRDSMIRIAVDAF